MDSTFAGKRYLVVGAGSIGRPVIETLLQMKASVLVVHKDETYSFAEEHEEYFENGLIEEMATSVDHMFFGTWNDEDRQRMVDDPLWGIVYAAGHCPAGGFDAEVARPLHLRSVDDLIDEFTLHVGGCHNVFQQFLPFLLPGSSCVVVNSSITRLTDETCPPWLHAGFYATAKAAQDELIRWWRRDPIVREKGILIHRIAPAAVDTPFHHGSAHPLPQLIPLQRVVDRILDALQSSELIDEMMLPEPAA